MPRIVLVSTFRRAAFAWYADLAQARVKQEVAANKRMMAVMV